MGASWSWKSLSPGVGGCVAGRDQTYAFRSTKVTGQNLAAPSRQRRGFAVKLPARALLENDWGLAP